MAVKASLVIICTGLSNQSNDRYGVGSRAGNCVSPYLVLVLAQDNSICPVSDTNLRRTWYRRGTRAAGAVLRARRAPPDPLPRPPPAATRSSSDAPSPGRPPGRRGRGGAGPAGVAGGRTRPPRPPPGPRAPGAAGGVGARSAGGSRSSPEDGADRPCEGGAVAVAAGVGVARAGGGERGGGGRRGGRRAVARAEAPRYRQSVGLFK